MENKTQRPLPMARVNTRIRIDQQEFIKRVAKTTNRTEGEVFRGILDEHIRIENQTV